MSGDARVAAARSAAASWTELLAAIVAELGELSAGESGVRETRVREASFSDISRGEVLRRAAELQRALRSGDDARALAAAASLVGLGEGSTPAGDDYLVGVLHALAVAGDPAAANGCGAAIRQGLGAVAPGRTTSASASWLAAAARGEASPVWSALLSALAAGDETAVAAAARTVRATGHTSGAFSLRGFLDTVGA